MPENKTPIIGIVTDTEMSLLIDGTIRLINNTFPSFEDIRKNFFAKRYDKVRELIDLKERIVSNFYGRVEIRNGQVYYEKAPCHGVIANKIIELMNAGEDFKPLCRFLENVKKNPNKRVEEELYTWLEHGNFDLTDDGCFLAYKRVRKNWKDFHSNTFDNKPGKTISMPMEEVDPNSGNECSTGFHFCSKSYLKNFYSNDLHRDVMVKINPVDVGAFPKDFGISKGRCAKYYVVQEIGGDNEKKKPLVSTKVYKSKNTMTKEEAVVALGLHTTNRPMAALKRRLDRGASAKVVKVDGKEMVELKVETLNQVMTFDRALAHFNCNAKALRKRCSRGRTADLYNVNGVEIVILYDKDEK